MAVRHERIDQPRHQSRRCSHERSLVLGAQRTHRDSDQTADVEVAISLRFGHTHFVDRIDLEK